MREQPVRRRSVPVQHAGGIITVSPGFNACGFSPLKQMRPTPDRQYSVCPTGCVCQAVRAPGVNDTTDARMRDGALPTTISS